MADELADRVGELSKEVKHLTNIVGKCANALTSITIDEYMDKYNGVERRKENMDFQVFMSETVLYRKVQQEKLDEVKSVLKESNESLISELRKLSDALLLLPCKERATWYRSMNRQVGVLWAFIAGIVLAIFSKYVNK